MNTHLLSVNVSWSHEQSPTWYIIILYWPLCTYFKDNLRNFKEILYFN